MKSKSFWAMISSMLGAFIGVSIVVLNCLALAAVRFASFVIPENDASRVLWIQVGIWLLALSVFGALGGAFLLVRQKIKDTASRQRAA